MPKSITLKTVDLDPASQAAAWNELFPVGTFVKHSRLGRPGGSGVTTGPATVEEGRTVRAVVPVSGFGWAVPVTALEVVKPRVVDPCMKCGHAKEGHGVRYAALQGDHEWIDPYDRTLRVSEPMRPAVESDRRPIAVDPYEPQPDREDRHAWAREDRDEKPSGLFARIAAAARRAA